MNVIKMRDLQNNVVFIRETEMLASFFADRGGNTKHHWEQYQKLTVEFIEKIDQIIIER